uniref:Uncharacterized protein n=1 Tax=Meloidogyne enterolobii TaxID=390850 RepID=A0A6V7UV38_MELEN|nr:unnamed protein product [Meloidogyne enterolobii]
MILFFYFLISHYVDLLDKGGEKRIKYFENANLGNSDLSEGFTYIYTSDWLQNALMLPVEEEIDNYILRINNQLHLLFHIIKMSISPFTDNYMDKLIIFNIFRFDRIGNQLEDETEKLTKILLNSIEKLISISEQDKI